MMMPYCQVRKAYNVASASTTDSGALLKDKFKSGLEWASTTSLFRLSVTIWFRHAL